MTESETSTAPAMLSVEHLRKSYGEELVLADINFSIQDGDFLSVLGPSGCGKTTLLRCVSGLMPPSGGVAKLAGRDITAPPPELCIVFQDYSRSLLPWLTVERNVTLPLKYRGLNRRQSTERAREALESVGLEKHLDKHPWQLSGGMQQRVAIARALAYRPDVLLMDEPFASVDAQTRADLEDLTRRLWREHQMTIMFVTHDIDESIYLGTHVMVLSKTPTRVVEFRTIDLPDERDQVSTKALETFGTLRSELYSALGHNVAAARPSTAADVHSIAQ